MSVLRILAIGGMSAAIYLGLGFEAVAGGRTLWPHVPAVVLILAAWSFRTAPAVLIAAVVGLGCDAIGTGPMGPSVIAAVSAAFVGSVARERWELESPLAASLFGMGVAAVFLAAPAVVTAIAGEGPVPIGMAQVQVARAIASALVATGLLLVARIASRVLKAMTAVLLDV
ncbi:hypothetical protein AYO47_08855 [Planctomyces sp. SCGC AG-212-M04]|nr:hypothetical protein AYO47_08855 [Planctomyces sp. SCGC AG-212-M04]